MPNRSKVSPAFSSYFAKAPSGRTHEAIVIVRPDAPPRPRRATGRDANVESRSFSMEAPAIEAAREALASQPETTYVQRIGSVPAFSVQATQASIHALAERPEVIAVIPNFRIRPIRPTSVKYAAPPAAAKASKLTWGLEELGIRDVWAKTKGKGVNVAVLDTGVHGDHPAIKRRLKKFMVFDPLGRRIKTTLPFDSDQHGTHVCGIIAGATTPDGIAIGVAPEADLFMGGVLIGYGTLKTLIEGISWAVEQGADIISMSLGFTYYEPLFGEIFQILLDQYGVLPVAAIGNENYGNTSSPGNAFSTLSVGAVEKQQSGGIDVAFFSSGASLVFPGDPAHHIVTKPDVCAPGVNIYSAIPPEQRPSGVFEYNYMSGTSMAAPHVAGVSALLMAARPDASVDDIVKAIKESAKHPTGGASRPDNRWGWGFVQPAAALKALG